MLKALGIDEADLARTEPLLLRDMERVCTLCRHKRQCDRELAAGTATEHYEGYCPNALHDRWHRQAAPSLGTGANPATET